VYLDFFMFQLLARRLQRAGKLSLNMDEKTGGTSKTTIGKVLIANDPPLP
jgi:hypothetical protein